jgi:hypothetical protein
LSIRIWPNVLLSRCHPVCKSNVGCATAQPRFEFFSILANSSNSQQLLCHISTQISFA